MGWWKLTQLIGWLNCQDSAQIWTTLSSKYHTALIYEFFLDGGRLKSEIAYTEQQVNGKYFGEETTYYESLIQTVKNEKENILTKEKMKEHFDMLRDIVLLQFPMFKR